MKYLATIFVLICASIAPAQQTPPPAAAPWWALATALSSDEMQGRDTGTEAYERAAKLVADHFKADGLKPAGNNGTYFQRVPMRQIDLDTAHSSIELVEPNGAYSPLPLLYETTVAPRANLPAFTEGELVFVGYGAPPPGIDLHGKIAVYFNNTPVNLASGERATFAATRTGNLADAGAIATLAIDNPATTEPTHWPAAYARAVSIAEPGTPARPQRAGLLALRISFEAAPKLFADTDINPFKLLADAEKGLPIPSLALPHKLRATLHTTQKDISSPNIIAILPGSDPKLANEYVSVSAHLDGYGFGTPVLGDNLYNGALDDAAYVATLLEMARNLASERVEFTRKHGSLPCDMASQKPCPPTAIDGKLPARSLLFCIFTGEEKGLLGSVYYTQHLTVPKESIVADFNLDQLRPIFPLKILTMEGIADSTLGDTAKQVAAQFQIELRPDRETERRLFSRSDNYSFVRIGIPIASFIFGYDPGAESERIYRDWYARRYHKPQDDLLTPIDWDAAVKFNDFYRALVLTVANAPTRPQWLPASHYAPKP